MAETSRIAWTHSTFNPWIGCQAISPGCEHCYAEAYAKRVGRDFAKRTRTSAAYWREPLKWNKKAEASGQPWRVFCGSLCDVFDNEVSDEWRDDLWNLIYATPSLTWLLLTKRVGNAGKMAPWVDTQYSSEARRLPPNVWLGATIVNQEEADRDVPKLLKVPAVKRFVSYEPALGPVKWTKYPGIDWIIVGGESTQGARARHFRVEWARYTVRAARLIKAAPFVKQMGSYVVDRNDAGFDGCEPMSWPLAPSGCDPVVEFDIHGYQENYQGADCRVKLEDRAGANPAEWPEDLRVQEFPV